MRKLVRFMCVVMIFTIAFSTTAFAANPADPRASNYFMVSSVSLDKTDSGLEIWFDVTGVGIMDQIGAKTVALQRSSDGASWTTVKTFSKEAYTQMIDSNTSSHVCCLTYTATKGYYYKACVTFYAKKGTGTGEMVQCTSTVKF